MTHRVDTSIPPDRRLPLLVPCAATLMTILDETVVNVALPTIQRELGFSSAALSWVVNAYLVAFGSLLLLSGRLGDLLGRRRLLIAGLALFTAASALCGLAGSAEVLVIARFIQGIGAALAAAVALGMVVALFEEPAVQARAIGIYSSLGAVGAALGLFAGGVITDLAGWRWAFLINVPIGVVTLVAARRLLAGDRGAGLAEGADIGGALLLVSGLTLALVAIVDDGLRGLGIAAALLLAGFAARQAMAARPLIPVQVLGSRLVVGASLVFSLIVAAMFGFQFLLTIYFQRVLGYSPLQSGLGVLPIAGGIGALSMLVFPALNARTGPRPLLLGGLVSLTAGMALMSQAPVDGHYVADVLPSVVLFAAGGGVTLPAVMTIAMSGVRPETAGAASGVLTTFQQVGGAIGLASIAALAAGRTAAAAADGVPAREALVRGFDHGWAIGAVLLAVALVLAAGLLRTRPTAKGAPAVDAAPEVPSDELPRAPEPCTAA